MVPPPPPPLHHPCCCHCRAIIIITTTTIIVCILTILFILIFVILYSTPHTAILFCNIKKQERRVRMHNTFCFSDPHILYCMYTHTHLFLSLLYIIPHHILQSTSAHVTTHPYIHAVTLIIMIYQLPGLLSPDKLALVYHFVFSIHVWFVKMRFSEVALQKFELDNIIPPLLYNGQKITKDESFKLLKETQGRRDQLNNLVYDCSQMPNSSSHNSNGWNVHWHNPTTQHRAAVIVLLDKNGTKEDTIYVHHSANNHPSNRIRDCVSHCIDTHSHVRKNKHEKGTMVSCGLRRETVCAMLNFYRPGRKNTAETSAATTSMYHHAAIDFHTMLMNSPLKEVYQDDIKQLQRDDLVWKVKDYNKNKDNSRRVLILHPTSAVSMDLTNAMHRDTDDAIRSTAIFYSSLTNPGTTFLLYPYYRLAIECTSTTFVNWDGKKQHHCSCTMPSGGNVFSFFNGAWESVKKQKTILTKMFQLHRPKISMRPTKKIYFRIKQKEFDKYKLERNDYDLHNNKYSLLLAEIVSICEKDSRNLKIRLVNSRLYDGELPEPVCKFDCVGVDFVNEKLNKMNNNNK